MNLKYFSHFLPEHQHDDDNQIKTEMTISSLFATEPRSSSSFIFCFVRSVFMCFLIFRVLHKNKPANNDLLFQENEKAGKLKLH